jgi:RNA polymerase sigma-70 factor (ECF subfamily)
VPVAPTDKECVRSCLSGHPESFRLLVSRYEALLIRFLAGRLGNQNDAIEAAQETMVRAYFALAKLRNADVFSSWLLNIADRVAKESLRKRHLHRSTVGIEALLDRSEVEPAPRPEPEAELVQAVADLPEGLRQAILMRFYGNLSCSEISRNLGVSLGTVTSRLSRAYSLLRGTLNPQVKDFEVRP